MQSNKEEKDEKLVDERGGGGLFLLETFQLLKHFSNQKTIIYEKNKQSALRRKSFRDVKSNEIVIRRERNYWSIAKSTTTTTTTSIVNSAINGMLLENKRKCFRKENLSPKRYQKQEIQNQDQKQKQRSAKNKEDEMRRRRKLTRCSKLTCFLIMLFMVVITCFVAISDIIPKVCCQIQTQNSLAQSNTANSLALLSLSKLRQLTGNVSAPNNLKDAFILRDQKLLRAQNNETFKKSKVKNQIIRSQVIGANEPTNNDTFSSINNLQISITPRVSQIRVPSESNANLKCLISSSHSMNKLNKKLDIRWSRYMYDENVYEQIESLSSPSSLSPLDDDSTTFTTTSFPFDSTNQNTSSSISSSLVLNRQQQLRDFLSRIRQETNIISDLLIEASLSISPVKFSDNASYFCTATDGFTDTESKAKIDLIVLSRPLVRLNKLLPSRDSKSALVYWTILSDGNTPIKKTILMVRNDTNLKSSSSSSSSNNHNHFNVRNQQDSSNFDNLDLSLIQEQNQNQHQLSSVVLDSDYSQWQRIEIESDGMQAIDPPPAQYTTFNRGNSQIESTSNYDSSDNVVRADLEISSSSSSSSSNNDQDYYFSQSNNQRNRWRSQSKLQRNLRSFNLTSLLPGVTYNLRLAAINDMGQSNWSYLAKTMPNEIPAQISEVYVLDRKNDRLAIGWRRPSYDTARTIRYEMQLFDLNRTLTLDANTNTNGTSSKKTNYMYVFFNLNPGTDYHFHVRACSRAGCSSYSTPKLLATTLDGEPDEPLDVELSCQLEFNRLLVSWLPPINIRGQLSSYSLHFQGFANYKNESNQWALDEWKSVLESADNHTLSFETSPTSHNIHLKPNTNYTVQICANNRLKHCGKLSLINSKSSCYTPPELPQEFPQDKPIKLLFRNVNELERNVSLKSNDETNNNNNNSDDSSKIESLVLELPFINRRNGSIDCIQIILIRLPKTYNEFANLNNFLPSQASDIKLTAYDKIENNEKVADRDYNQLGSNDKNLKGNKDELAVAYLAEELDSDASEAVSSSSSNSIQLIVLGDGTQNICRQVSTKSKSAADIVPSSQYQQANNNGSATTTTTKKTLERFRVFDGSLKADTYYSGFIKLILKKPKKTTMQSHPSSQFTSTWLTNEYQTSDTQKQQVNQDDYETLVKFSEYFKPVKTGSSVIEVPLTEHYLDDENSTNDNNHLTSVIPNSWSSLVDSIKRFTLKLKPSKLYNQAKNYFNENFKLDFIGNYMMQTSPVVLSVALLFTSFSLLLIFIIWLFRLVGIRRRKRKLKLKRKLQKHQEAINATNQQQLAGYVAQANNPYVMDDNKLNQEQQQQLMQQVPVSNINQNQNHLMEENGTRSECPIHSSPANISGRNIHHVCQQTNQYNGTDQQFVYNNPNNQFGAHEILSRQDYHDTRNCKTLRRSNEIDSFNNNNNNHQNEVKKSNGINNINKSTYTLSHNNVVATLAKRFNKSVPIRLFGSVFERRLRAGILSEEYEQLPRPPMRAPDDIEANTRCWIKLRPQMVVSRDDSISALISGRDTIDASLIRPPDIQQQQQQQQANNLRQPEKKIICAKSPLDADSVWDFWRLIYEQEVSTLVMLTQTEDGNSGELRCAQYWPTQDNEETTILSPCNDYVQKSPIPPAKFKIRQETFEEESREDDFKVRRLTLVVMATKPSENLLDTPIPDESGSERKSMQSIESGTGATNEDELDMIIVERFVWHLQFYHWNTSSLNNQMRLIKFIELANEKHSKSLIQESPSMQAQLGPMLVHCYTGLGRSGLFTTMSYLMDELSIKLNQESLANQQAQKLNLFQLVSKLRLQRDMILSPYRFYELLYQLVSNCIPNQEFLLQQHHHHHTHHIHANQTNHQQLNQQQTYNQHHQHHQPHHHHHHHHNHPQQQIIMR